MALDEPHEQDRKEEVQGITFLVDPFAFSFMDEVKIGYDEEWNDFVIANGDEPLSSC